MILPLDPTEPGRAQRIVAIQRAAYAVEAELMGFHAIPPLHETEEQVATLGHLCWRGAFDGPRLVGIVAWDVQGDALEIDRLAVDPAFGRQGRGRQLVQAVPEVPTITVSTGHANRPALSLYSSLGFREIGRTEIAEGVFTTQLERRSR